MHRFLFLLSLFFPLLLSAQTKEITILSVNDIHAAIDRFPKFVALVDSMRTVYPDLLLFSAGDNRTGNPASDMHPDAHPVVALMNRAGFNLSAVGNHEFDGSVAGLRSVVNNSNFRYVCANVYTHDTLRLHVAPYRKFEIDGVRIAVLGLLQTGANGLPDIHPDLVRNVAFRKWEKVADEYSWLRNQCDVFILLVHEEYPECVDFLQYYPFADVLIGAHTHKPIKGTELHNGVMITQADAQLKYVTHITLQLTDGKITGKEARLLDVNAFSRGDPQVQAMVDELNNNPALHRQLTTVVADFATNEELGYLMTDAIRAETGADVALQNPGGVRLKTFPKGEMTVRDVYRLDPFNNEVVEFHLTGEELLRLIEAVYIVENRQPPFVSGITYQIEIDAQRNVKSIQVKMEDGTPLHQQRKYKVVMNSYIAAVSSYEKEDPGKSIYRTTAQLTIEYLEKQQTLNYQGVKRMTVIRNL